MNRERPNLDCLLLPMIRNVPFQTVFIMGDHRSGTTILNEVLGATGCFNVVTAYHVIYFKELLHHYVNHDATDAKKELAQHFEKAGLYQRGIDRVNVSAETPEEYGFILRNAGYRPFLSPGNFNDLVCLCQKISLTEDPGKAVLLKNPWDFANFIYVKKMFPQSRFVFIHRHPIRIINSQLVATRAIFNQRNAYIAIVVRWYDELFRRPIKRRLFSFFFSSHLSLGVRITARHVFRSTNYFIDNVCKLNPCDYINVKYEDLCVAPKTTVEGILDRLDAHPKKSVPYESFINVRGGSLLPEVRERSRWIFRRTMSYLNYFGYTYNECL